MNNNYIKPLLRWTGGKTKMLDCLMDKFPTNISNYYEPFLGGGSVLFRLISEMEVENKVINNFYVNDINHGIISLYTNIKYNINHFLDTLENYIDIFDAAEEVDSHLKYKSPLQHTPIDDIIDKGRVYVYNFYRELYNHYLINNKFDDTAFSVLFLILNKTSYHGLYRVNKNGLFNTSYGFKSPKKKKQLHNVINNDLILNIHELLNLYDVSFTCQDYKKFLNRNFQKDDFIYMDPPYYPVHNQYFTQYTSDSFTNEHRHLIKLTNNINNRNIKFLQSNSYTNYILKHYDKYNIDFVLKNGTILDTPTNKCEVLISNFSY